MKTSKIFLLVIFVSASVAVFAQQTPAPAVEPTAPEPFVFYFGDGDSYLGIYPEDITRENMSEYKLNEPRGVGVEKVLEDSPAAKAGLQKGDVILRFNGEEVTSARKLTRLISEVAPDHQVKLTISRDGRERDINVTLGKRKEMTAKVYEPLLKGQLGKLENLQGTWNFGSYRRIGVSTMQLNKQLADYFGVTNDKAVLVTEVSENSPASKAGIKAGDVIIAVDGETIDSVGDLSRAINKKKEGDVTLTIIRNRSQQLIKVTPEEHKGMIAPELFNLGGRIRAAVTPEILVTPPSVRVTPPNVKVTPPSVNVTPRVKLLRRVI
jgi:serine protease Do